MIKRRPRTITEWAERMQAAEPPTDDDVTILPDGRRLDSKEAVESWLEEVEALRTQKISIRDAVHKRTTAQPQPSAAPLNDESGDPRPLTDAQRLVTEAALANYEMLASVWSKATDDGPHNAYLERPMMRSMVPKPLDGQTILDLGCGSGAQCEWLLSQGAEVIGVDLSPSMVEATRLRCKGRGRFFVGDATKKLDLAPASVDGVTASLVFDYFEDWTDVLERLRALLRPNAWIAISDGHPSWVLRSGRKNYFETGVLEDVWVKGDVSVVNRFWHRPLAVAIDQIASAGFVVERVCESKATPEVVSRFPELADAVDHPSFVGYLLRPR